MKKYGIKLALAAAVFCMAMPFASFAGTWKSDANGMWYQFDDGTYPDRKCWRIQLEKQRSGKQSQPGSGH